MLSENDKLVLETIFNPLGTILEPHSVRQGRDEEINATLKACMQHAISTFQEGNQIEALTEMQSLLDANPECASLYNDRAQMYSIMKKYQLAFNDLNKAIEIGEEHEYTNILSKAYCQRAMIQTRLKVVNEKKNLPFEVEVPKETLNDFKKAAEYGNKFAKEELKRLNPYSQMCNAMLKEINLNLT